MTVLGERLPTRRMDVDGCEIAWGQWGTGLPLALVHGAGAQAGWWTGVIPELAQQFQVVALDLSGHGESGWRRRYTAERWAQELLAVAVQQHSPAILVAHSLGARISLIAAALWPELVRQVIMVDPSLVPAPGAATRASGARRWYASRNEILASFALLPPQPILDADLVRNAAAHGVVHETRGWTWSFDPRTFGNVSDEVFEGYLPRVQCGVAVIRGELSEVAAPHKVAALRDALGIPVPEVVIPGAHHHVPLDRPLLLAQEIVALADRGFTA